MRAFILLTLAAVATAELCSTKGKARKADTETINQVKAIVRTGAGFLFGQSCPKLAGNIEKVAFGGACRNLAKQAVCYGIRTAERYDGVTMVSYGQLAGGVDNIAEIGNLACAEGVACYKQIARHVKNCMKANANFVDETVAAAEMAYRANAEAQVQDFVSSQANTLFGELASLAMGEFSSVADVQDFIDEFVSDDLKSQIEDDAAAAAKEVAKLARSFCNTGCIDKTATFVKALFNAMNNGQCVDARYFCGPCKDNAHTWFTSGGSIPCCLNKVIAAGIKAFKHVADNYGDQVEEWAGMVSAELSEAANEKAEEIKAAILEQAVCIAETYSDHKPVCA